MDGKLIRNNRIYFEFEIKDGLKNYDVLYLLDRKNSTYRNTVGFMIERDGKDVSSLTPELLQRFTYTPLKFDDYAFSSWDVPLPSHNEAYLKKMLKNASLIHDEKFLGYYGFLLYVEMGLSLDKNVILNHIQEIIPYIKKMSSFMSDSYLEDVERQVFSKMMTKDEERLVGFAQLLSGVYSHEYGKLAKKAGIQYLKRNLTSYDEECLKALKNCPCVSFQDASSDVVMKEYDGIGILPDELFSHLIAHGDSSRLYDIIMNYDHYLDYPEKDGDYKYTPLVLFRYLYSHGYQDKKEELAKRLLLSCCFGKDYSLLRVFVSDDWVRECLDKGLFQGRLSIDLAPILFEDEKDMIEYAKKAYCRWNNCSSYYEKEEYWRNAYALHPMNMELGDYYYKDFRKKVRENMGYLGYYDRFYDGMIFLLRSHDKNALRNLSDENLGCFAEMPSFYVLKTIAKEELSKKSDNMHEYQEK